MDKPSEEELEDFVREHKHEVLRDIIKGIKEKYGVIKSKNWVTPRRKAALLAESLAEEIEPPTSDELLEEEPKIEEPETEKDPQILEMNEEIKRLKKAQELEQTKEKLALAKANRTKVEELLEDIKELGLLREEDATFIGLLKRKLEGLMAKHPNYYPMATCPSCKGAFFWIWDNNLLRCYVCEKDYRKPAY